MDKARIFVVIPIWGFHNKRFDTNNFFINQALALQREGHRPMVISIRLRPIKFIKSVKLCEKVSSYVLNGMEICVYDLYVPFPTKLNLLRDKYISYFYRKIIKNQIKQDKENSICEPHIIHAHVSHECAYYCLRVAKQEGIPLVVTEHYSGLLTGGVSKFDYARVKETICAADAFIFVGTNFKERVCEILNIQKKVFVIPNMVNTDRYVIDDTKRDEFVFLSAGTLKKNKRIDLVIQAFSNEFRENDDVKLLIAGDGVEMNNLVNLTSTLNMTNKIHFFGEYQIDQAGELFSHSDAFVLTSEFETFGIVYVEALFCGLPCIGTKGQGPDDIINSQNGFLVNHGSLEELQEAMRYVYNNKKLYDKTKLRKDAIDRFSERNISQKLTEIYKEKLIRGNNND